MPRRDVLELASVINVIRRRLNLDRFMPPYGPLPPVFTLKRMPVANIRQAVAFSRGRLLEYPCLPLELRPPAAPAEPGAVPAPEVRARPSPARVPPVSRASPPR